MKKILALVLLGVSLTGCVQPMTKSEVNAAVYEPLPSNYKEQIQMLMESRLKDPDTAKFKFFEPKKGYTESTRHFAYVVPVGINAKNSYGGYTGYKAYYFSYYQGTFKDVTDGVKIDAVKWSEEVK
ncbi:hypothetical protein NGJ69_20780 [Atlantibacter hermannii]|uniref:hypothetical protein n=1 Tax=Atlantibacter hermannii TaxID=565 RepID=UPI002DBD5F31|nr:hypothetical protein [Atlantibacter hermannii]MEB7926113.1 hypothetical protein [Atlantibacter hermannii]